MGEYSSRRLSQRRYTKPYKRLDGKRQLEMIFWAGHITKQQKRGIIVSLPKAHGNQTPEAYHRITLYNSDYKIIKVCVHY